MNIVRVKDVHKLNIHVIIEFTIKLSTVSQVSGSWFPLLGYLSIWDNIFIIKISFLYRIHV